MKAFFQQRPRLVVFLFPLLLSLPFLRRTYFVDDGYFVRIASWLNHGEGGYRRMLDRMKSTDGEASLPYPVRGER